MDSAELPGAPVDTLGDVAALRRLRAVSVAWRNGSRVALALAARARRSSRSRSSKPAGRRTCCATCIVRQANRVPDRDAQHRPARRIALRRPAARRHLARPRRPHPDSDRRGRGQLQHPRAVPERRRHPQRPPDAPAVVGAKMADGRWDLGALVKRDSREQDRTGPNRPDRDSVDRGHRRPHLAAGPARLRRRARADRLPVAERAVLVRLLPGPLDAELRARRRGSATRRTCRSAR